MLKQGTVNINFLFQQLNITLGHFIHTLIVAIQSNKICDKFQSLAIKDPLNKYGISIMYHDQSIEERACMEY